MAKRVWRLPNDILTENIEEYLVAWHKLAAPIAEATNTELCGFNPDLVLREKTKHARTVSLPTWFAKSLSATINYATP